MSAIMTVALVDHHLATLSLDGDRLAEHGVGRGQLGSVGRHDVAGDHVVEQDVLQLGRVLEQPFNGARRQLGERLIGGGEDGERPRALECLDQTGSLDSGHEGLEAAIGHSRVYDILGGRSRVIGLRGWRQDDRVDHVDDAVAGLRYPQSMTVASLIITLPPSALMVIGLPSTVSAEVSLAASAAMTLPATTW